MTENLIEAGKMKNYQVEKYKYTNNKPYMHEKIVYMYNYGVGL